MGQSGRYKQNQLPLRDMVAAMQGLAVGNGGVGAMDEGELECALAVLIHRKLIKGYLSHRPLVLVVSKTTPFPRICEVLGPRA